MRYLVSSYQFFATCLVGNGHTWRPLPRFAYSFSTVDTVE